MLQLLKIFPVKMKIYSAPVAPSLVYFLEDEYDQIILHEYHEEG